MMNFKQTIGAIGATAVLSGCEIPESPVNMDCQELETEITIRLAQSKTAKDLAAYSGVKGRYYSLVDAGEEKNCTCQPQNMLP